MNEEIPESTLNAWWELARVVERSKLEYETHLKATHERFNVFSTVLKADDEVRLHTRFLHCLLDPDGSHDCGPLFLDLFFETLHDRGGVDHEGNDVDWVRPLNSAPTLVKKEFTNSNKLAGQIDLLMGWNNRYAVAIENKTQNKTKHREQDEQLTRYAEYLEREYMDSYLLLFLTPDGWESNTAGKHPYLRISYKEHILPWLEACLRATYEFTNINQVLIQYRAVVRQITNTNSDPIFMKPIVTFIHENPDVVRHNNAIQKAIIMAADQAWDTLANTLSEMLVERNVFEVIDVDKVERVVKMKQNSSVTTSSSIPLQLWMEQDNECIGIGICVEDVKPEEHQEAILGEILELINKDRSGWLRQSDIESPRFPTGWHILFEGPSEEQDAKLIEQTDNERICNEVCRYLESLIQWSQKAEIELNGETL